MPGGVSSLSDETLIRQVRTLPGRPADGVVRCVYESFVRGKVVGVGAAGKIKSAEHALAPLKCIAAARLENTSSSTDGFQRHPQILSSLRPNGSVFAGTKDSAKCVARPLTAAADCLTL